MTAALRCAQVFSAARVRACSCRAPRSSEHTQHTCASVYEVRCKHEAPTHIPCSLHQANWTDWSAADQQTGLLLLLICSCKPHQLGSQASGSPFATGGCSTRGVQALLLRIVGSQPGALCTRGPAWSGFRIRFRASHFRGVGRWVAPGCTSVTSWSRHTGRRCLLRRRTRLMWWDLSAAALRPPYCLCEGADAWHAELRAPIASVACLWG